MIAKMLDETTANLAEATAVITRIRELHGLPALTWMNTASEYEETIEAVRKAVTSTAAAEVIELAACEAGRLVLRAGALYRFTMHAGCEACQTAARPADEYDR